MIPKERIVIGTQIFRDSRTSDRLFEHATKRITVDAVDDSGLNSKSDNAPRELIHYDENPMGSQGCGFATKEIDAPQTVSRTAQKGQPRWTIGIRGRSGGQESGEPHPYVQKFRKPG
jgi:hypothetical protein